MLKTIQMLVKQCDNTFIRIFGEEGYLFNQLNQFDRAYNDTGAEYLKQLPRVPREIDDIVNDLLLIYPDASFDEIKEDLISVIEDLEANLFVVTGATLDEIAKKEVHFSYSNGNLKNPSNILYQKNVDKVQTTTQELHLQNDSRFPRLKSIQFELTSRCNERCIHCYIPNSKKDAGTDMTFEKFKEIIDDFAEDGGIGVTLSGGEIFLHKDLLNMIDYCREKDMIIILLTNLIAITDAHIRHIKQANICSIQTSLYSMDPSIHDAITKVKGSHARTKNAIEKLVAADIPVQISCPVMKINRMSYKDVLKYAQGLNIKASTDFVLIAEANMDTSNLSNRLSIAETEELLRDIIEYDIDYRNAISLRKPIPSKTIRQTEEFKCQALCGAGINSCCITESGDVYPCSGWQDYTLGNVHENSLTDIWKNSEKIKAVRRVTHGDFPKCIECDAYEYCARCLVRNYNEMNGDMLSLPEHNCQVAHLTKRLVEEYRLKHNITDV